MKLKKLLLKPIKAYKKHIKHSIIPKPYSHQVKMNILIKKGQQSGTVLIPCTIYAMDHHIDLNPALIRKKGKKVMKHYKVGEKIKYNSNNYIVELTTDEKDKGYVLKELERCSHCGQKLVIAEVKQTRYRSCPSIEVKLGDKAKEDIIVPVEFGVNKSDITNTYWTVPLFLLGAIFVTITFLGFNWADKIPSIPILSNITIPKTIAKTIIQVIFIGFTWLYFIPLVIYGRVKLLQWYYSVKDSMTKSKYKVRR